MNQQPASGREMIASRTAGLRTVGLHQLRLPKEVEMLPPREREIAGIVYALHSATAKEVIENLSVPLRNASVRSMMNRLVRKGIFRRSRVGPAFVYLPLLSFEQSGFLALRRFAEDHFDGSLASAARKMRTLAGKQGPEAAHKGPHAANEQA